MGSNLGVFGKRKCVFHVDPEIADSVLDLAMAEKDLDGTKVAGRPVDDRRPGRCGKIVFPRFQW